MEEYLLEHFSYGNYEGYRVKGASANGDSENYTSAYRGAFIPLSQGDIKYLKVLPAVIISTPGFALYGKLLAGKDEFGRGAVENHTAIIPKELLSSCLITYEDVAKALEEYENQDPKRIGRMEPLKVRGTKYNLKEYLKDIRNYIGMETLEKIMDFYRKEPKKRLVLLHKALSDGERIKLAHLLSMLIDVNHRIANLSIFTDRPYPDMAEAFNLIIARTMPEIKLGNVWQVIVVKEEEIRKPGEEPVSIEELYR
ncbi:MAG: hypothetical protein QW115_01065 [Thermoplasmata archaeon]